MPDQINIVRLSLVLIFPLSKIWAMYGTYPISKYNALT